MAGSGRSPHPAASLPGHMLSRRLRLHLQHAARTSTVSRRLRRFVRSRPRLEALARNVVRSRPRLDRAVRQIGADARTPNQITNALVLDLIQRDRLDEAAVVIHGFLERNPKAARSFYIAGVVEMYRSDHALARQLIDRAYEMSWTVRDDLAQLPGWYRHIADLAEAHPTWPWPAYMIAKATSRVFDTSDDGLMLLVDGVDPATVVAFGTRFGEAGHRRTLPVRPGMRAVVFEGHQPSVGRHRRRLSDVDQATVRHVVELGRAADVPRSWPRGLAARLLGDVGVETIDRLHLDAEFGSTVVLLDVLDAGCRPAVVSMSLVKVTIQQRLDAVEALRARGYVTQLDHDQLVAVADGLVEDRRVHAWRTPSADFDGHLLDDFISTPPADLAEMVCAQLIEHQVRFFVTPVPEPHVTRISLGNPDKNFAISRILDIEVEGATVHVAALGTLSRDTPLVRLYLVDEHRRYLRSTVELDFWTERGDYVRTGNPNCHVTWIPAIHRERSMFALNPAFLYDDPLKPVTMEERLGLAPSVLDTFDFDVDVVFTWVDGNDPAWQRRRAQREASEQTDAGSDPDASLAAPDTSHVRYRDRDELRYALRSVAAFMPYVRRIFLVTDQQSPAWLGEHPMVTVVDHSEIFEDPTNLPCFNSNAIESQLHRIPGLAEHFVYFNDDVMLLGPTPLSHFFLTNGVTRSFFEPERSQYGPPDETYHNSKNAVLNAAQTFQAHFGRTFHQYHRHTPFPLRRSVLERMHEEFATELRATATHHFRSLDDVAPISSLYQYYAFHVGAAIPSFIFGRFVNLGAPNAISTLENLAIRPEGGVMCINDNEIPEEDEAAVALALADTLRRLYPIAAPWERP